MSRGLDQDERDHAHEQQQQTRMPLSQGRGGGSSSSDTDGTLRGGKDDGATSQAGSADATRLAAILDEVSRGKPTLSRFIERLEGKGIAVVPSIQSSGRWNGLSYKIDGQTINGSALGRAYTAQGLQDRKGVQYRPEHDNQALLRAAEKAGFPRLERMEDRNGRSPESDRSTEHRIPKGRSQNANRSRNHDNGLSRDQLSTLREVGTFRAVQEEDLLRHRYGGHNAEMQQDLRDLREKGLVKQVDIRSDKQTVRVVVITREAKRKLDKQGRDRGFGVNRQMYHHGLVKRSEIAHDSRLYSMYNAEKERIETEGGTVARVVLDYELKQKVFSELNRESSPERSRSDSSSGAQAARKQGIADANNLKIVNGKIVLPDVRIEYETQDGEMERVDLELTSESYKKSQIRAKQTAGLKLYAPNDHLGRGVQEYDIAAGLVSF
jgi:hypothetical protein